MKPNYLRSVLTVALGGLVLAGATVLNATQTVRELWDNVWITGNDRPINQVNDGTTSCGFQPGVNWYLNRNVPLMQVAQNFNVGGVPGLPVVEVRNAGIWSQCFLAKTNYTNLGLIDDDVYGPTMDPRIWGVRQLATNAQINFNANGVYYFSFGVDHGGSSCVGIGFTTGTNESSRFVGAGFTRPTYQSGSMTNESGPIELGNSLYISTGTLDQTDPSGTDTYGFGVMGQALVRAYSTNSVGTQTGSGTLIGRLTTSVGGNATLQVVWIPSGTAMPTDVSQIVWDVTYSFNETSLMTHLLIWHNTLWNVWPYCASDSIRVGDSFGDVAGLENFQVVARPQLTNYAGTAVSIWATNGATAEPPSFQWRKNGVNLSDVTGSISNSVGVATAAGVSAVQLSLLNPVPSDTGNYDIVISNSFGMVTSAVVSVTILPSNPPVILANPVPATRLLHGYYTFNVDVAGTPPLGFQWKHANTNLPGATGQILALTDIQTIQAGDYSCLVTNAYGSTNSAVATLIVTPPVAGSFTEAVMAKQPYGYWQLNETGTNTAFDYAGGHNGAIGVLNDGIDYFPTQQGLPELRNRPFPGFESNNTCMGVTNGWDNELNGGVIVLPVTNMTIMGWVYPRGNQGANAGLLLARYQTDTANLCGLYCVGQNALGQNTFSFWWNGLGGTEPTLLGVTNVFLPTNQWSFIAMTVNPTNVSLYVGYGGTLYESDHNAATDSAMGAVSDAAPLGPYVNDWPLAFGCDIIPWAHKKDRNFNGLIDSVAVFGKTLTTAEVQSIYQAGAGTAVTLYATPSGSGTSTLSWINGVLMSSPSVAGPYSNVDGAISPYHTVTHTGAMQFYRVSVVDANGTIMQ
jgi:hypothetical protein